MAECAGLENRCAEMHRGFKSLPLRHMAKEYALSVKKIKILWSGITGRTGTEALKHAQSCDLAEIVAGICRNDSRFYNYTQLDSIKEDFDVIVDFSHKDSFETILNFAIKVNKPLIIGTDGLSEQQIESFERAAKIIPIFRGGNFRFKVKKFIDAVVDYAKNHNEDITLVETHYKTKKIPSQTAKVIVNKIKEATGKEIVIKSFLEYDELISDWKIANLHCRVIGFDELAKDVLKIAHMFADKKPDGVWDLDKLLLLQNQKQ